MNIKSHIPVQKRDKKGKPIGLRNGVFTGAKKYFGPQPIIYRSSLEYKFMINLEVNPKVEKWSSEHIVIPYTMQEKVNGKFVKARHNYHTDFTVILVDGTKYIIEIKPAAFTPMNESQIHRNPIVYKNACKWRAAIAWSKANGYIFKVLNEKHLQTRVF